jgi:hypothetical protein
MNCLRSALFCLGLLLTVSATQAQETNVKANIPFDFVVGHETLPAGEYRMVTHGSMNQFIVIRSSDSKAASLSLTYGCSTSSPSDRTKLVFHALAGRYFLSQIRMEGTTEGREFPMSDVEVRLAKNNPASQVFVAAALLTR